MSALLEVRGLRAAYGPVQVLHGLDLSVDTGEIVVLLGGNGAGKTTTLRAISRMPGLRVDGEIGFDGRSLSGLKTETVARRGIAHVPQGRGTFPELTVEENLLAGGYSRREPRASARTSRAGTTSSRGSPSGGTSPPVSSPAGNSRWSLWRGPA